MKVSSVTLAAALSTAIAAPHTTWSSYDPVSLVPSVYRTLLSLMPDFDWSALYSNPSYFIGVMTQMDPSDIPFTRKPGATKTVAEETITETAAAAAAENSGSTDASTGAASSAAASSSSAKKSSNAANANTEFAALSLGMAAVAGGLLALL